MKRNTRKGFTGIELVIVIAIIAILAASLIPSFGGLFQGANKTADTQLVRNLNTALLSDTDGVHNMTEALALAAEWGFDVATINAKALNNEIVWDSRNNVFCYLNDGAIEYIPENPANEETTDADYWVISDEIHDKYATYYNGDAVKVETSKGFDVGTSGVTSVTYTNDSGTAQTVTIRTNGGTLTINAPLDTVIHYGDAEEVYVQAVAKASYHAHGAVKFVRIDTGRIVVEQGAEINTLLINNENVIVAGEYDAISNAYTMGEATTKDGLTYKHTTDVETLKQGAVLFAGGIGTKTNPYLIANTEHYMNIGDLYREGNTTAHYFKFVADIIDADADWCTNIDAAIIDLNGHILNIDKTGYVFHVQNSVEFMNGTINFLQGGALVYANTDENANVSLVFNNLELTGDITVKQTHYGPLVKYMYSAGWKGTYSIAADKVVSNMHIVNTANGGDTGALFGYVQGNKISAEVTNCVMNGSLQGYQVGGFFNACSYPEATKIVNSGNTLNGTLLGANVALPFGLNSNYDPEGDSYTAQNALVTVSATAKVAVVSASEDLVKVESIGDEIKINHTNDAVSYYIVDIEYWVNRNSDGSGGYPRPISKTIEVNGTGEYNTGFFMNKFEQVDTDASGSHEVIFSDGNCKVWAEGDTYKIYDPDFTLSGAKAYIRIYGYKGDGTLVTYQNFAYNCK